MPIVHDDWRRSWSNFEAGRAACAGRPGDLGRIPAGSDAWDSIVGRNRWKSNAPEGAELLGLTNPGLVHQL